MLTLLLLPSRGFAAEQVRCLCDEGCWPRELCFSWGPASQQGLHRSAGVCLRLVPVSV